MGVVTYKQISAWIQQKQPVVIRTSQGEGVYLLVKLYEDTKKVFAYDRAMQLIRITMDDINLIKPTRISGSFFVKQPMVMAI